MATKTNKKTDSSAFNVIERMMRYPSKPKEIPSLKERIAAAEKEEYEEYLKQEEARKESEKSKDEEVRYTKTHPEWTLGKNHKPIKDAQVREKGRRKK